MKQNKKTWVLQTSYFTHVYAASFSLLFSGASSPMDSMIVKCYAHSECCCVYFTKKAPKDTFTKRNKIRSSYDLQLIASGHNIPG